MSSRADGFRESFDLPWHPRFSAVHGFADRPIREGFEPPAPAGKRGRRRAIDGALQCRRRVQFADYTITGAVDIVLREVTSERSQLEQVSEHSAYVEERPGPNDTEPIDEPPLRNRLHVLTLGVARKIEA